MTTLKDQIEHMKENANPLGLDRFDLEQHLMKCWNVTDDIALLNRSVLEKEMTTDEISNCLMGMQHMYELKFNELFDTFSELVKDGTIT